MADKLFFKVVCESVDVFEKSILIDKNCSTLDEAYKIANSHPELMKPSNTWILYPMIATIK